MAGRRGDGRRIVGLDCGEGGSSRGWDGLWEGEEKIWLDSLVQIIKFTVHSQASQSGTLTMNKHMICTPMIISLEECASLSNLHEGSCGLLWSGRTLGCVLRRCVTTEGLDTREEQDPWWQQHGVRSGGWDWVSAFERTWCTKTLVPSLTTWVGYLDLTWQKERTDSCKLPILWHMCYSSHKLVMHTHK